MAAKERFMVTGGAGFIGSHLCELLISSDHPVVAIDDLSTGKVQNLETLIGLPGFQFVRETIMNSQVLDRLVSQVDVIVHLAAAVGVKLIVEDPVRTINTNILGTEAGADDREPLRLQGSDRFHLGGLRKRGQSAFQRGG